MEAIGIALGIGAGAYWLVVIHWWIAYGGAKAMGNEPSRKESPWRWIWIGGVVTVALALVFPEVGEGFGWACIITMAAIGIFALLRGAER